MSFSRLTNARFTGRLSPDPPGTDAGPTPVLRSIMARRARTTEPPAPENLLYYGDNLDVLRRYVADESVDLVYLDPPFNSNQDYNVLFRERDGTRAAAQIIAFNDTWLWDQAAARAYHEVVEAGGKVSQCMQAFRTFLGENDMLAYLSMMAPRLVELRRVLKPKGSIYLHCDPTASHYLKMLMDAVFGPQNFLNEITWKRTHAHGSSRRYGPVHDTLLFYGRTGEYSWVGLKTQHSPEYIEKHFRNTDESGRRFAPITLTGSGVRRGESGRPWRDINPTRVGRHWALPGDLLRKLGIEGNTVQARLEALDEAGMIYWPARSGGTPRLKWYADQLEGMAVPDVWSDIPPIASHAAERLGYPTQKPEALLERIIGAGTSEGATVLDPFCGCGTTIAAAQKLNRRWIGFDITHLAIGLIKHRLRDTFGPRVDRIYRAIGEPVDLAGARELAESEPYQFQWWALGLVGARPVEGTRGADRGVDGRLYFHDEGEGGTTKQVIFSVKAGSVTVSHLRDLRGVIEREGAAIGALISMENPTAAMRREAAAAGFYTAPGAGGGKGARHPRLQLLTIELLLGGTRIDMPPWHESRTFRRAPRARRAGPQQPGLFPAD